MKKRPWIVSLSCLLTGMSAGAQDHLYTFHGAASGVRHGFAVANAGDVDDDGHDDMIVGAPRSAPNGLSSGRAFVYSGATGAELFSIDGTDAFGELGWAVAGVGDVDGDDHDDVVIGAPFSDGSARNSGTVRVVSGKTGAVLYTMHGATTGEILGISVAAAGDVDKDGRPDILVGGHGGRGNGINSGVARVYSGRTGLQIRSYDGDSAMDFLGHSVASAGDLDRDGHADLILGVPDDDDVTTNAGSVRVVSGKTGRILFRWDGESNTDNFGHSVGSVGDVDRDGFDDIAVGAPQFFLASPGKGYVRVFSGRDGAVLHTFRGDAAGDFFGEPVTGGVDWNSDGHADIVVGVSRHDGAGVDAGLVRVFSGKDGVVLANLPGSVGSQFGYSVRVVGDANSDNVPDLIAGAPGGPNERATLLSTKPLSLSADVHEISVASGGTQRFQLAAGPTRGGELYIVLGSMRGKRPGVEFSGNVRLPLAFDPYMLFTLTSPNTTIESSFGNLDPAGRATASLRMPSGLSGLIGAQLHHAFLTIDINALRVTQASVAVPLRLAR